MKLHKTPLIYKSKEYFFNSILGCLLYKNASTSITTKIKLPDIANKNIFFITDPYSLKTNYHDLPIPKVNFLIKGYAKILVWSNKKSFLLSRILAIFRFPVFQDAEQSIQVFRSFKFKEKQNELCLPRALFVSTTSKKFKKSGTMFIGVFLPTTQMHAWVIEDGLQPDKVDDIWICYQPVAVLC